MQLQAHLRPVSFLQSSALRPSIAGLLRAVSTPEGLSQCSACAHAQSSISCICADSRLMHFCAHTSRSRSLLNAHLHMEACRISSCNRRSPHAKWRMPQAHSASALRVQHDWHVLVYGYCTAKNSRAISSCPLMAAHWTVCTHFSLKCRVAMHARLRLWSLSRRSLAIIDMEFWYAPSSPGTIPSNYGGERQDGRGATKRIPGGGKIPYCNLLMVLNLFDCALLAEGYLRATQRRRWHETMASTQEDATCNIAETLSRSPC